MTRDPSRTIIHGVSDDLLEFSGALYDEVPVDQDETRFIGLSTGVLLRMTCDEEGFWRFNIKHRPDGVPCEVIQARGEGGGNDADGCPGYSDKVVTAPASWAVVSDVAGQVRD